MKAEEIYDKVQEYNKSKNITDRNLFLKTLSNDELILYRKFANNIRQKKYNDVNREKMNKDRAEYKLKIRAQNPDKYKKQNLKDVNNHRMREKIKHEEILKKLEKKEAFDNVDAILNDIIDVVPNLKIVDGVVKKKRGRKVK